MRISRQGHAAIFFRQRILAALTVITLGLLARPGSVSAQGKSSFELDWAKLIAAAKQEGSVTIASGGQPSRQYRPVLDAFAKTFGVKVEMSTGSATDTVNRVLAERKAGRFATDVGLISSRESNQRLLPAEALTPFAPLLIHPEVLDPSGWYLQRHWYVDKFAKFIFVYHVSKEDDYSHWYNSDRISAAEIATIKKQTDFFDAKWRGKIAGLGLGDPSAIRGMVDSYFEADRGPEWVRTYLLNAGVNFTEDRRILETWLTAGRFPLLANSGTEDELRSLAKKGLPLKNFPLPRQQAYIQPGGSGCCISAFAKPPHPNAAKLFINWFLSKEGQTLTHTLIPSLDRASLRTDIPFGEVVAQHRRVPGKEYVFPDADPNYPARQEEAQKWVFKVWESRQR